MLHLHIINLLVLHIYLFLTNGLVLVPYPDTGLTDVWAFDK